MSLIRSQIPPPEDSAQFENIICNVFKKRLKDENLQRVGRSGQTQNGIDIFGHDKNGAIPIPIGIQCKLKETTLDKTLPESEVLKIIAEAKKFQNAIEVLYIATTAPRDVNVQQIVWNINAAKTEPFLIELFFWDEAKDIIIAHHTDLLLVFYPELEGVATFVLDKKITEALAPNASGSFSLGGHFLTARPNQLLVEESLEGEYKSELNEYRKLIDDFNPTLALNLLNNLKERCWDGASDLLKYKLLVQISAANNTAGNQIEAGKIAIKAYQYSTKDEKPRLNKAIGHMLLGQRDECKAEVLEVLKLNPANTTAYAILIEISNSVEEVIDVVPEALLEEPEICGALGMLEARNNKFQTASIWLDKAVQKSKKYRVELVVSRAQTKLQWIFNDVVAPGEVFRFTIPVVKNLEEISQDLAIAWSKLKDDGVKKDKVDWLMSRSVALRLLEKNEEAFQTAKEAYDIAPEGLGVLRVYAIRLSEQGRKPEAVALLRSAVDKGTKDLVLLNMLAAFLEEENPDEAEKLYQRAIEVDPEEESRRTTSMMLVLALIERGKINDAENLVGKLEAQFPLAVETAIAKAKLLFKQGDLAKTKDTVASAISISASLKTREVWQLVSLCIDLKMLSEAESLLSVSSEGWSPNPIGYRLVVAHMDSGDYGSALRRSLKTLELYGQEKHFIQAASAIYDGIGDLVNSDRMLTDFLAVNPENAQFRLRLALLKCRQGKVDECRGIIERLNQTDLQAKDINYLAQVYFHLGEGLKAINVLYEGRRRFYSKSEIHLFYMGSIVGRKESSLPIELKAPVSVAEDTAVLLSMADGKNVWYTIENRKDADFRNFELDISHHISKLVLGKSAGDEIEIPSPVGGMEKMKILELKSKFIHVLHQSMNNYQTMFPGVPGLASYKIEPDRPFAETTAAKRIEKGIEALGEKNKAILSWYDEGRLTLGAASILFGADIEMTLRVLGQNAVLGFRAARGDAAEIAELAELLQRVSLPMVIDISSLFVIHELKITEEIFAGRKVYVTQSTVDYFRMRLSDVETNSYAGVLFKDQESGSLSFDRLSPEDRNQKSDILRNILNWIQDKAEIAPCNLILGINANEKKELDAVLGEAFYESILLAQELGGCLFSEDERLRGFAKGQFGVSGCWTQGALMYLSNQGGLENIVYRECSLALYFSGFRHTYLNVSIYLHMAEKSGWKPGPAFKKLLGEFGREGSAANISLMATLVKLIRDIWIQEISRTDKEKLVEEVLGSIRLTEVTEEFMNWMDRAFRAIFLVVPFHYEEAKKTYESWKRQVKGEPDGPTIIV